VAVLANACTWNVREPLHAVVKRLTNGNVLLSATDGNGWIGSRQQIDAGADGVLTPDESTVVQFRIGLANRNKFTFLVDISGTITGRSQ
jgi:hypothetical protein